MKLTLLLCAVLVISSVFPVTALSDGSPQDHRALRGISAVAEKLEVDKIDKASQDVFLSDEVIKADTERMLREHNITVEQLNGSNANSAILLITARCFHEQGSESCHRVQCFCVWWPL